MDLVKMNSKMKDRCFKGCCVGYFKWTTVLHLSKQATPEYKLALPEGLKLVKNFSDCVSSMENRIIDNINYLQDLAITRDVLLPKLMSGKVKV
jgi:hypothetical protein